MIEGGNDDATLEMRLCRHCRQPMMQMTNAGALKAEWRCTNEACTAPDKPHTEIDP